MRKIPHHLWVTSSAWASRVIVAIGQLLVIRLITQTRGTKDYALFAILYGLAAWFLTADIGIGYGIQNEISGYRAKGHAYGAAIRRALTIVGGLLFVESAGVIAAAPWLGNHLLRQFNELDGHAKSALFLTAALLLLLTGLGQVAYRIWYAEQKGYWSNVMTAAGQVMGVACVFAVVKLYPAADLIGILGAYLTPSALVGGLSLVVVLWNSASDHTSPPPLQPFLKRSLGFGAFGIAALLVLQIDLPVISQFLPPAEIAAYAVLSRVFSFVYMVFSSALAALWPVCAEHLALNHWRPVHGYIRRYIAGGGMIVLLFSSVLMVSIDRICDLLAPGAHLHIRGLEIGAFAALYLIRVWTDTFAMALQSKANMVGLWAGTIIQAACSITLEMLLVPRFGLIGVPAGLIVSYLLTNAWILPWALHVDHEKSVRATKQEVPHDEAVNLYSNV